MLLHGHKFSFYCLALPKRYRKEYVFMKKYASPEIEIIKAETNDIMVGSDVIIDICDLFTI